MTLIKLESVLKDINERTTFSNQYPVLTSSKNGICLQETYFKKQVASNDNTGYKIIKKGQFTYRAMSDTGEFFPNMLECVDIGIVSPAYPVFEVVGYNILNPYYLKYYFKSKRFQNSISLFAQGSTRTSIKYNKIKTLELDIPNVNDQLKIVKKLDLINDLISEKKDQLEKINALIKSQFVEMFKGENTPVITKKIEELCSEMMIGPFGSALHKDEMSTSGDVFVLGTDNAVENSFTKKEIRYIDNNKYQQLKKYTVKSGDIIISMMGTIGRTAVIPNDLEPAIISSHLCCLTPDNSKIYSNFLQKVFVLDDEVEYQIHSNKKGAIMNGLNLGIIKNITIHYPELDKQRTFLNIVEQIDKQKFVLTKMTSFIPKILYL